jgi:hypothetical protein
MLEDLLERQRKILEILTIENMSAVVTSIYMFCGILFILALAGLS